MFSRSVSPRTCAPDPPSQSIRVSLFGSQSIRVHPDTPIVFPRAPFRAKVDGFVPRTQQANFRIVHEVTRSAPPPFESMLSHNVSPHACAPDVRLSRPTLQGYLAHEKQSTPLGPPWGPRHSPTVDPYAVAVSYKRGTLVNPEQNGAKQARVSPTERSHPPAGFPFRPKTPSLRPKDSFTRQ